MTTRANFERGRTRANRLDLTFLNVSFVGSNALADALSSPPETYIDVRDGKTKKSYAEGVMVTQVVPYYDTESPGVSEYRADIDEPPGEPDGLGQRDSGGRFVQSAVHLKPRRPHSAELTRRMRGSFRAVRAARKSRLMAARPELSSRTHVLLDDRALGYQTRRRSG